jgi:PBP1b-binding outer membrane lipoprotein LpoB
MQKALIGIFLGSIILLAGCSDSSSQEEFNDEMPYTPETIEDTSRPTVVTELPTTTNDEIVTQADTSL